MTLDEILNHWEKDAKVDTTELGEEAVKEAQLHHKYWKFLCHERVALKMAENDFKKLRAQKRKHYKSVTTVKDEIQDLVDMDDQVITAALQLGIEQEKERLLESIIKEVFQRNYEVGRCIDWKKFVMGAK